MNRNLFLAALFIAVTSVIACKDSGNEVVDGPVPQFADPGLFFVPTPSGGPQELNQYSFTLLLGVSVLADIISVLEATPSPEPDAWYWRRQSPQITRELRAIPRSDGDVDWRLRLDGLIGLNQVSGLIALTGTADLMAAGGDLLFYSTGQDDALGQPVLEFMWRRNDAGNGNLTTWGTILAGSSSNPNPTITTRVQTDLLDAGGGSLTGWFEDKKVFSATWQADGSGSFMRFDPETGEVTAMGSWSASQFPLRTLQEKRAATLAKLSALR